MFLPSLGPFAHKRRLLRIFFSMIFCSLTCFDAFFSSQELSPQTHGSRWEWSPGGQLVFSSLVSSELRGCLFVWRRWSWCAECHGYKVCGFFWPLEFSKVVLSRLKENQDPEAAMLGHWLVVIRAYSIWEPKLEEAAASPECSSCWGWGSAGGWLLL